MDMIEPTWTRAEFRTYVLLYCANANYEETQEESALIRLKVGNRRFERIHWTFDKDNDYIRVQKIKANYKALGYSQAELEQLLIEIKAVFFADGEYDILEQNVYRGLKEIVAGA